MNPIFQYPCFNYAGLNTPTPYYIVDRALLRRNMRIIKDVQERSGCKILLAMKAFSTWGVFDEIVPYVAGVATSSVNEALLGQEHFKLNNKTDPKTIHVYSPAYSMEEMITLCKIADHIVFNSLAQWKMFRGVVENAGRKIEIGLRINPEYSEVSQEIYNPCTTRSRFGVRLEGLMDAGSNALDGIDGFHFHTMCQQGSDVLQRTLEVVCERFEKYFDQIKWINFGGGHHITRMGYDINRLCRIITAFREKYGLDVILEPGETHVIHTGFLVSTVLDVIENPNGIDVVILDTSAAAHMPDILEMPYTPEILGARRNVEDCDAPLEEGRFKYIIGSKTCLSGDIIGEYMFPMPLKIGDRLTLEDMSQYTTCKNTTFNGIQLPSIVSCDSETEDGSFCVHRQFGYEDFRNRLS
ncbi:MAG: carboxynorspermidine decarboxylase [Planctomycetia bacterium]|nr:carboxynorspermidine decarboxylase [Planctomycetia bacterium]